MIDRGQVSPIKYIKSNRVWFQIGSISQNELFDVIDYILNVLTGVNIYIKGL